jgi:hypothetical protein
MSAPRSEENSKARVHAPTPYQLVTKLNALVFQYRGKRVGDAGYPSVSHLLGSDWSAGLPAPRSLDHYLDQALARAKQKWPALAHWVGAL